LDTGRDSENISHYFRISRGIEFHPMNNDGHKNPGISLSNQERSHPHLMVKRVYLEQIGWLDNLIIEELIISNVFHDVQSPYSPFPSVNRLDQKYDNDRGNNHESGRLFIFILIEFSFIHSA
jgi:hypothetical protein